MNDSVSILALPRVFRVLVIDDDVGEKAEARELVSTYIQHAARSAGTPEFWNTNPLWVDVCFASTPEDGINRWLSEFFDLTLIDSNFKRKAEGPHTEKRGFLDVNIMFRGAYLYRSFQDVREGPVENPDGSISYTPTLRINAHFYIWTGLSGERSTFAADAEKQSDLGRLVSMLQPTSVNPGEKSADRSSRFALPDSIILKKANADAEERLKSKIISLVKQRFADGADLVVGAEEVAARFISLYRSQSPEWFHRHAALAFPGCDAVVTPFVSGYLHIADNQCRFSLNRPDSTSRCIVVSPALKRGFSSLETVLLGVMPPAEPLSEAEANALRHGRSPCGERHNGEAPSAAWPAVSEPVKRSHTPELVAAATPLTGVSVVGRQRAIRALADKVRALLEGPFDRVVLKTVYLDNTDQWDNLHWPLLQAQSHHRCRCVRSAGHPRTLWNTGVTAMEMMPPAMMRDFLRYASQDSDLIALHDRIVISLGSKFPKHTKDQAASLRPPASGSRNAAAAEDIHMRIGAPLLAIWSRLFEEVFLSINAAFFPQVEINARHYLRECVAHYLHGNEYISPTGPSDRFASGHAHVEAEFALWLCTLDTVAKKYGKHLYIKLPHRGDLPFFIALIKRQAIAAGAETRIRGISLINAFKSGVCATRDHHIPYTPAWYGGLDTWDRYANKKTWSHQMSGEMLNASRNAIMPWLVETLAVSPTPILPLALHIGGGIVNRDDIKHAAFPPGAGMTPTPWINPARCCGCGACVKKSAPYCRRTAIRPSPESGGSKQRYFIDPSQCGHCGECATQCAQGAITVGNAVQLGTWPLLDLDLSKPDLMRCRAVAPNAGQGRLTVDPALCKECGSGCAARRVCRHKAFILSGNRGGIDIARCTNCRLCMAQCRHGAVRPSLVGALLRPWESMPVNDHPPGVLTPRIAYCLHELCDGCGVCARTFYCDTFLDRRGADHHPVMDARHCTGCGLCAQSCPNGALQLFHPQHVSALITAAPHPGAAALNALQIPHVAYRQDACFDILSELETYRTESTSCGISLPTNDACLRSDTALLTGVGRLWRFRKKHDQWRLGSSSARYVDERSPRKGIAAARTLNNYLKTSISGLGDISRRRMVLWKALFDSDPGQVMASSPMVFYPINEHPSRVVMIRTPVDAADSVKDYVDFNTFMETGISEIRNEVSRRLVILRKAKC